MAELPDWHVLGDQITQDTTLGPGQTGLQTVDRIPYRIDSGPAAGSTRWVEIEHAALDADKVQSLIEADLGRTHSVASLGKGNA